MKLLSIIFVFINTSLSCFGQKISIEIARYASGDTSSWYHWYQNDIKRVGLSNLTMSTDSLHFRFATCSQIVDIRSSDMKTFKGTVANFATSEPCHTCLIKREGEFYSRNYELEPKVARRVYELFDSLSIFSIPTDEKIKGWSQGYDGDEYLIEYSSPTRYSFKSYWTPSEFKTELKEAATIDTLANQLMSMLDLPISFSAFMDLLPDGCYQTGSMFITCHESRSPIPLDSSDW